MRVAEQLAEVLPPIAGLSLLFGSALWFAGDELSSTRRDLIREKRFGMLLLATFFSSAAFFVVMATVAWLSIRFLK
jgi:hypothetical protein